MSSYRDKAGRIGLFIAGSAFHAALLVLSVVLLLWLGKIAYGFGYDVFNEHAMSPGQGEEVTVVIRDGLSGYEIGKILESKGLIENAYVFAVQERLSVYHGKIKPDSYKLSTAYTPTRMLGIMAGDEEMAGTGG